MASKLLFKVRFEKSGLDGENQNNERLASQFNQLRMRFAPAYSTGYAHVNAAVTSIPYATRHLCTSSELLRP